MNDHWITERDLVRKCYCGHELRQTPWESVFMGETHYKGIRCEACNCQIQVRVPFMGSGHDSWDGTNSWERKIIHESTGDVKMKFKKTLVGLIQK